MALLAGAAQADGGAALGAGDRRIEAQAVASDLDLAVGAAEGSGNRDE